MNKRLRHLGVSLLIAFPALYSLGQQRTDADWDAQGVVAMNQYHDCARAKRAFEQESALAQASPIWLDQVARASECAGDLTAALNYYDRELKKLPDTPRLVQKVGDVRYKQELQAEQEQATRAATLAAQRQQQEAALASQRQQEQLAIRDAQELAAARARIDQSMQKLGQSLEGDFKYTETFTWDDESTHDENYHIKRHVTQVEHCSLSYVQEEKGRSKREIHMSLGSAKAEYFRYDKDQRISTYDTMVSVLYTGSSEGSSSSPNLIIGHHSTPNSENSGQHSETLHFPNNVDTREFIRLINELGRACAP